MSISPKSVFITGCLKGIGLELVKQFLSLPKPPEHVFATGIEVESSEELRELARRNVSLHIRNFDVLDYPTYQSIAKWVEDIVGSDGLNLLINNAAILDTSLLAEVTRDKMMQTFEVNAVAPLLIVQAFQPLLVKAASSGHGQDFSYCRACVINISSKFGSIDFNTFSGFYPYKTSKAALNMITRGLSVDLKKDGILCLAIHPGWVQTDMGGTNAPLPKVETVSNMLFHMTKLKQSDCGCFKSFDGSDIPW